MVAMIRCGAILSVIAFVLAACGGPDDPGALAGSPLSQATTASSAESGATAKPGASARPTRTPLPSATSLPATPPPTPTAAPQGLSRSHPFPPAQRVSVPGRDVQVLESRRGAEAWAAIKAANQFNEPAPAGMEYLLVRIRVKITDRQEKEHRVTGGDYHVTGDRLVQYSTASVIPPKPVLEATLFPGGELEGWAPYMIAAGEQNLFLITGELFSMDDDKQRFIALDPDASLVVSSDLESIEPNLLGTERKEPAPLGVTAITDDWEITLLKAVRGAEALEMIKEANQFNDPAPAGQEYIVVKMRLRSISTDDRATLIDQDYFKALGAAAVVYEHPAVVPPRPSLQAWLFPGGELEGWAVVQAAEGEQDVTLVFDTPFSFDDHNKRYMALERGR